jgi:hypothetical protein
MAHSRNRPEKRYAAIIETLIASSEATLSISEKKGFSAAGLALGGNLFAMLNKGRLVVKLPEPRVNAIIAAGDGERFDLGHGRLMREWVALVPESEEEWLPLAREAMEFVASGQ